MSAPLPPHAPHAPLTRLPLSALTGTLAAKVSAALSVASQALARFPGPGLALAWTGGKDSTLMVRLFLEAAAAAGCVAPPVVCIDEGDPFPEVESFVSRTARAWGLALEVVRNDDLLGEGLTVGEWVAAARLDADNREELSRLGFFAPGFAFDPEALPGCHLAKTAPLGRYLVRRGAAALATGIRRDEHPARQGETAFSPRHVPPHLRVHPILELTEAEVWAATFALGLPFCELYREGYRSLSTRSGTVRGGDVPAWEQDLENTPERGGRAPGKEAAMAQLRALGYM